MPDEDKEQVAPPEDSEEAVEETVVESAEAKEDLVPVTQLKKVSAEAGAYRKELAKVKAELAAIKERADKAQKAAERAKLEEVDRLKAEMAELKAEADAIKASKQDTAKRAAIINAASELGFQSPKDAAALIELSEISMSDSGEPDSDVVKDLVTELSKSKPYLLVKKDDTIRTTKTGPTNPSPPDKSQPRPKYQFTDEDRIKQLREQEAQARKQGQVHQVTDILLQIDRIQKEMAQKESE